MKITSFLFLSLFMIVSANDLNAQRIKGNGNVVSQDRNVKNFNEVSSQGSFDVVLTDGNDFKVTVEAEENLQELIEVEVDGSNLRIRPRKGTNFNSTKSIIIHVTAPTLKAVKLSGSGNVKSTNTLQGSDNFEIASSGSGNVDLDVETSSLTASIAGSGNMSLKGKTKELEGRISGSGNIKAKDLQSEITEIHISGSGNAEVVATQKLSSKIAGSGDVKYWGNASVDSKVAGSGSVRKQN